MPSLAPASLTEALALVISTFDGGFSSDRHAVYRAAAAAPLLFLLLIIRGNSSSFSLAGWTVRSIAKTNSRSNVVLFSLRLLLLLLLLLPQPFGLGPPWPLGVRGSTTGAAPFPDAEMDQLARLQSALFPTPSASMIPSGY
ncbi:hypothetical protein S40293_10373 [Stachybotrys chartarum IBT 40293]|nr:hypothetical protein S40293_10373 [Stachybotrys chartarum IBT 40293]